MPDENKKSEPTHAQKFNKLLGDLLAVPKSEILKREAEYKKQREEKRLRKN